jgi:hypothetical protein
MLDPEVKPSPAREIAHKGKGCLAVLVAALVLAPGEVLTLEELRRRYPDAQLIEDARYARALDSRLR